MWNWLWKKNEIVDELLVVYKCLKNLTYEEAIMIQLLENKPSYKIIKRAKICLEYRGLRQLEEFRKKCTRVNKFEMDECIKDEKNLKDAMKIIKEKLNKLNDVSEYYLIQKCMIKEIEKSLKLIESMKLKPEEKFVQIPKSYFPLSNN